MHGDEYRARRSGLQPGQTTEDPHRRSREPEADEGFDITPEQRLVCPISEIRETVEVPGLYTDGNADAGTTGVQTARAVREDLLDLVDLTGVDFESAFE